MKDKVWYCVACEEHYEWNRGPENDSACPEGHGMVLLDTAARICDLLRDIRENQDGQ